MLAPIVHGERAHTFLCRLFGTRNGHWCLIHLPVISLPPGRRNTLAIAHQQSRKGGNAATTKTQLIIVLLAACMCLFVCRCICACMPYNCRRGWWIRGVSEPANRSMEVCVYVSGALRCVCPTLPYIMCCDSNTIRAARYSERWVGRHGESKQGIRAPSPFTRLPDGWHELCIILPSEYAYARACSQYRLRVCAVHHKSACMCTMHVLYMYMCILCNHTHTRFESRPG